MPVLVELVGAGSLGGTLSHGLLHIGCLPSPARRQGHLCACFRRIVTSNGAVENDFRLLSDMAQGD